LKRSGTKAIAIDDPTAFERLVLENRLMSAEIAALRSQLTALETLADTDTLTPLSNRRVFIRRLDQAIRQVERHGTPIALVFIDLDRMKTVNDNHGHLAGDAALNHVAALLRNSVRATDMVARIGGDEFGMILDYALEEDVRRRMTSLCETLEATPLNLAGARFTMALSWGVTMIVAGDTVETALARSDTAMYAAKDAQRSDK
jgi:diguanylate cyclase (GGDEF)-like protein